MNQSADDLPELPGVDVSAGLSVVRGNSQLYRRMLLKFADSYADFERQFRQAQLENDSDPDAARRCAHSIKGVAANLGVTVLSQAASQLEQECANQSTDIDFSLDRLLQELSTVTEGLEALR